MGRGRWLPAPPAEHGTRPGTLGPSSPGGPEVCQETSWVFRAEAFRALWLRDHVPQG